MNDESSPAEDESVFVFEFAVPAETFILADAIREHPAVAVGIERVVPTDHTT